MMAVNAWAWAGVALPVFSMRLLSGIVSGMVRSANPGAGYPGGGVLVGAPPGTQIASAIIVMPGIGDFTEDDDPGRVLLQS